MDFQQTVVSQFKLQPKGFNIDGNPRNLFLGNGSVEIMFFLRDIRQVHMVLPDFNTLYVYI